MHRKVEGKHGLAVHTYDLPPNLIVRATVTDEAKFWGAFVVCVNDKCDSVCVVCPELHSYIEKPIEKLDFYGPDVERSLHAYNGVVTFISRSKLYRFCFE